ncbi:uncharacterized protein N7506_006588 [Penicillium brevicompactum]|uniref:uncharacterized protein n=1 Tax=Penicillium brevicompactum TaxID=5074 RepID=UPI0025411104|nr:uncharacterized protein N7506_006588 [Penicillium brevicompactum]KAJ5332805.1 hypothetical protein N7506_006588 [Penicillium brevicompactum]
MARPRHSPPNSRIGASKSRSGCKTCKIRRVKCGEERPKCLRCTSTGRKCDFEGDEVSRPAPLTTGPLVPSYTLSSSPNSGRRERRAFEYYFQHAAKYLSGGMDIDFWTSVVPQVCRSEPPVWDAVIAISSLFEYPEQSSHFTFLGTGRNDDALNQAQKEALTWYSRSISGVHSQIDRGIADPYIALVSCVLFICVETIQGRMEEALKLLQQGFSLIQDLRLRACQTFISFTKVALLENTIIPLFLRLNTIALNISGTPASELLSFSNPTDYPLTSLASARHTITMLAAECMIFHRDAELHLQAVDNESDVSHHLYAKQQHLISELERWLHEYGVYCQTIQRKSSLLGSSQAAKTEPILLTYHAAAFILVSTCLTRHQSVYDSHMDKFKTIVEQSSFTLDALAKPDGVSPPFTFEMGVGLPLHLTALKCRHPALRRKALQLSKKAPPVQGFYKCLPGIALAEHLMAIEEDYSAQISRAASQNGSPEVLHSANFEDDGGHDLELLALIPEEARICDAGVFQPKNGIPPDVSEVNISKWNRGPDQLFISFRRLSCGRGSGTWVIVHDCVPLDF